MVCKADDSKKAHIALAEQLETRRLLTVPATNWPLAFDDEFNGTGVDYSKWSNYLPWTNSVSGDNRYHATNNAYASYMEPQDVSESGGSLQLSTSQGNFYGTNGHWFGYSEMMLTTNSTFNFDYGYAEIRCELPTGAGNWPAFWSLGSGWPPENDIMEAGPGANINHQGIYDMSGTWQNANPQPAVPAANTWHTYGMEWGPGYEKFNFDGIQTLSVTTNVPNQNMYFLLNSGVATASDSTYSSSNNNTLNVDYVRVYGYNSVAGPQITDGGFESPAGSTGFTQLTGTAIFGGASSRTGNADLIVNPNSLTGTSATGGVSQTVTGLSPNTTYTFSGYGRAYSAGQYGQIGVSGYGGSPITSNFAQTAWGQDAVTFTTGSTNTSALVYLTSSATAPTYFDDTSFEVSPTVSPLTNLNVAPGGTASVPLTVNTGGSGSNWTLSATSSNQTVLPNADLSISGTTLNIQTPSGQTGSSTVSVNLTDMFGSSYTATFNLTTSVGVTLNGDPTPDIFRLVRSGANLNVFENNTTATPTYQYPYSTTGLLTIDGGAGNDQIILDYSGGDPIDPGGFAYAGGSGTNSLLVQNMPGTQTATIKNGVLALGSDAVSFSNTQSVSLDLGSGTSTLTSTTPVLTSVLSLTVDSGATLNLGASSTLPTNTIANISGTFNLNNQNESIDQLSGNGRLNTGTATLLTLGTNNGSNTFSGNILGSAGLTKVGTGTATLSGVNTFTGQVTIGTGKTSGGNVDGALCVTTGAALASTTQINFTDNNGAYGTLQLNGASVNISSTVAFNVLANSAGANSTAATIIDSIAGTNSIAGAFTFGVGGAGYRVQVDSGTLALSAAMPTTSHTLYLGGAGSGSITAAMGGTANVISTGPGNWNLGAAETYTGVTNVSAGSITIPVGDSLADTTILTSPGATLNVNGSIPAAATVTANGTVNFGASSNNTLLVRTLAGLPIGISGIVTIAKATNHQYRTLLVASGVTFAGPNSKLDITNNDLDLPGAALSTITTLIGNGLNSINGSWTGNGITSSTAAADPTHLDTVGVITNNTAGAQLYGSSTMLGKFDGTTPGSSDVLVKFTYVGDTNLDGKVDASDYSRIDNGFNNTLTGWYNGDFNYDNIINGSDYTLIDNAFNNQSSSLSTSAQIAGQSSKKIQARANVYVPVIASFSTTTAPLTDNQQSLADLVLAEQSPAI